MTHECQLAVSLLLLPFMVLAEEISDLWTPSIESLLRNEIEYEIRYSKKEEELNGKFRFQVEDLLSEQECQDLLELSNFAELGSGVDGIATPHTIREEFRGLTINELNKLITKDEAHLAPARLLMDKSDSVRRLIQSYFNVSHLYFDYTHLVCRTVLQNYEGYEPPAWDLSHPIHGDNCYVANGRCIKRSPAFTWRDYSAIIYLNDDIRGGEFFFTDMSMEARAKVNPRCGRVVAFSSDALHGVNPVTSGTRCALALWMTTDVKHQEIARLQTERLLEEKGFGAKHEDIYASSSDLYDDW